MSRWGGAWHLSRETLPVMLCALAGLLFSGLELDTMTSWRAFVKVDKFLILVPIMLNLKGNLEMNLSMRMATEANIGEIDHRRTRQLIVKGNMTLLQVQALIVASAAGIMSFILGNHERDTPLPESFPSQLSFRMRRGPVHSTKPPIDKALQLRDGYFEFALVLAVSQLAASLSSAVQGSFICALVVWARQLGFDPDNMVIPIAGSLGDLTTLTLLGLLSAALLYFEGTGIATIVFLGLIILCVICMFFTLRNVYVRELLAYGWGPLFAAAAISSMAGLVLEKNASHYQGYPLLAPVVAGMPSIAAAVHTSRLSSALHANTFKARTRPVHASYLPLDEQDERQEGTAAASDECDPPTQLAASSSSPWMVSWWTQLAEQLIESLSPQGDDWIVPLTLVFNVVMIQVVFFTVLFMTGVMQFGLAFFVCLVFSISLLAGFALVFAHTLCLFLWYWDYDPDTTCMPFTTALVDICGQLILLLTYNVAIFLGDRITTTL